uniref:Uncharacterized protein n=1 Tax=Anguilla anguilla TaxID=7936 RepID=A0A0E9X0M9_ANGAN
MHLPANSQNRYPVCLRSVCLSMFCLSTVCLSMGFARSR